MPDQLDTSALNINICPNCWQPIDPPQARFCPTCGIDQALWQQDSGISTRITSYNVCYTKLLREDVLNSKKLTEDLRLLDCSRPCTGGASILLVSENYCKNFTDSPIWISGVGQKTTSASFTKNLTFDNMESTKIAATKARNNFV